MRSAPTPPPTASTLHTCATVFTDQINATEGIEYMRFAQWKFDPTTRA